MGKRIRQAPACSRNLLPALAAIAVFVAGIAGCGGSSGGGSSTTGIVVPGGYTFGIFKTFAGGADGGTPDGPLVSDAAGNIYGATEASSSSTGTFFEIPASTGKLVTLATTTTDFGIVTMLVDSAGNLFGEARSGLFAKDITIFKVVKGSGQLQTLATFSDVFTTTQAPIALDGIGNLYILLIRQGLAPGVLYEVPQNSTVATQILDLSVPYPGFYSLAALVADGEGNVFGVDYSGGSGVSGSDGTAGHVWELASGTSTARTLAPIDVSNGAPIPVLIADKNGSLYGITTGGSGSSPNAIYEVPRSSSGFGAKATVAAFPAFPVATPSPQLVVDSAGNLYGFSIDAGLIYEVAAGSGTVTTVVQTGLLQQPQPAALLVDSNGNLFCAAEQTITSATPGVTAVFEVVKGSSGITYLAGINANTSVNPQTTLGFGPNGLLYGTALPNGSADKGSVFRLTPVTRSAPSVSGGRLPVQVR